MATFRKRGESWRAEIVRNGVRKSATFDTKREAQDWAATEEVKLKAEAQRQYGHVTLRDVLVRFREECVPHRRDPYEDGLRVRRFLETLDCLDRPVQELGLPEFSRYRDARLREVKASTVQREFMTLHAIFKTARVDWEWIKDSPVRGLRMPKQPPPRNKRWDAMSIEKMRRVMDAEMQVVFLLALETAMRLGEIAKLEWVDVDVVRRFVVCRDTKNGDTRQVPLSTRAVELLRSLPLVRPRCFAHDAKYLGNRFVIYRRRAGVEGLTFHDTRHEALTRMAQKMGVLDLARVAGHRDLKSLMTYYNPTVEELADRLG
jgi:integrase